eukprot:CAMPEP_0117019936 /NCGR_PEP_ID=MMETSP0472-20121206/15217_1 /TAXON_ID=693140 ORGANISM="Tiarina fusus, Strain LIS" /NCGR_SAMPLE_ID=MMETSP0472 /ASSEMBLY_ACC=CAM_ASM_000603 /LENGTH=313 /DNA_ID=CAMNT_0004725005 /DNA_START=44 /DNA_END=985 /DNA_ORIENTATION=-
MATTFLSSEDIDYVSNFSFEEPSDIPFNDFSNGIGSSERAQVTAEPVPSSRQNEVLLEPTPISPQGMVVVDKYLSWNGNNDFLASLKNLLKEPSAVPVQAVPCHPISSFSDESSKAKGQMPRRVSEDMKSIGVVSLDSASDSEDSGNCTSFRSSHVEQWNQRYRELKRFRKEHGHCLVPLNWPSNHSLAHWVKRQRYQFRMKREGKHSTLTCERQAALEGLGFVWDSHAAGWEERWNELRTFRERHGHCNVPKKYPENQQLAVWVKCQRRQFKLFAGGDNSNMTKGRIEKLQVLGFVFDPRSRKKRMNSSIFV